jgi:adenylate kinase family enzyme
VFDTQTQPLLDFYAKRGILVDINGEQPVQEVFALITNAIDGLHDLQVEGVESPPVN